MTSGLASEVDLVEGDGGEREESFKATNYANELETQLGVRSLNLNFFEDGVNGKWTANGCNDCVTSSMSEAQKNEKKMKSGNCRHKNQTKVLVAHKECPDPGCMVWECLYLNCDLFKFDPNKPNVQCTNCSMEPTIVSA